MCLRIYKCEYFFNTSKFYKTNSYACMWNPHSSQHLQKRLFKHNVYQYFSIFT